MCVTIAYKHWDGSVEFATYVTALFTKSIRRYCRWRAQEYIDETFIDRKLRSDIGQRILLSLPDCDLGFSIWIEKLPRHQVCLNLGISHATLNDRLYNLARVLRERLADECYT
jgi:hypothetical protein